MSATTTLDRGALTISLPLRETIAALMALTISWAIWTLPETLSVQGRQALIVTALAVIGWTMTRLPDSLVAIAAALALVFAGLLSEEQLFAAMGSELVWLLIAAFVIAAVIRKSGLMEHLVGLALPRFGTFPGVVMVLTVMVALTAFFIPSTSGRAALLLPVFLALADKMPDGRLVRPLALLFPTVILLSAGGSLIGAGAHLVAVDAIARTGGPAIGYAEWFLLAFPVTMAKCIVAAALILWLFVPADLRRAKLVLNKPEGGLDQRQKRISLVLVALVALWATTGQHGISIAVVALVGAVTLLTKPFSSQKTKEVFKGVDSELIVYLAATVLVAEALIESGADKWLAASALVLVPEGLASSTAFVVSFVVIISVLAHLVITSRSARAAVLIPAVALPVAAFGHDPALIVMVATLGTGFCQTMMASAKPVAIYGNLELETYQPADLMRLAVPLMPVFSALLVAAALVIWPEQLDRPTRSLAHAITLPADVPHDDLARPARAEVMRSVVTEVKTTAPPVVTGAAPDLPSAFSEAGIVPLTTSLHPRPRPAILPVAINDNTGSEAASIARVTTESRVVRGIEGELIQARREIRSAVRQMKRDLGLW